jgi:beta-galactosidase
MTLASTTARAIGTIFSAKGRDKLGVRAAVKESLSTFEELNQNSGFVLYETTLPPFTRDPSELVINDLRDRAYVYVDEYFVGILSRENAIKSLPISSGLGTTLQILVENQGRINFQVADDYKVRP